MKSMKRLNFCVQMLFLFAIAISMSSCVAAIPAVLYAGGGAALGVGGMSIYNAANDDADQAKIEGLNDPSSAPIPYEMTFAAPVAKCSESVVSTLLEKGESVEVATDTYVKTGKFRETPEVGMITSLLGKSEIYSTKSIILANKGGQTKVSVQVNVIRKTGWTQETKKQWPEAEAKIRAEFFSALSKKIRPVKQ